MDDQKAEYSDARLVDSMGMHWAGHWDHKLAALWAESKEHQKVACLAYQKAALRESHLVECLDN